VHGTLLMSGADRLCGDTGTPVVSQRKEAGKGILGRKSGRGKYDMWYDWVVKKAYLFLLRRDNMMCHVERCVGLCAS